MSDVHLDALYKTLGFKDLNSNRIIEKNKPTSSGKAAQTEKEGYQAEIDRIKDGKITESEAWAYYFKNQANYKKIEFAGAHPEALQYLQDNVTNYFYSQLIDKKGFAEVLRMLEEQFKDPANQVVDHVKEHAVQVFNALVYVEAKGMQDKITAEQTKRLARSIFPAVNIKTTFDFLFEAVRSLGLDEKGIDGLIDTMIDLNNTVTKNTVEDYGKFMQEYPLPNFSSLNIEDVNKEPTKDDELKIKHQFNAYIESSGKNSLGNILNTEIGVTYSRLQTITQEGLLKKYGIQTIFSILQRRGNALILYHLSVLEKKGILSKFGFDNIRTIAERTGEGFSRALCALASYNGNIVFNPQNVKEMVGLSAVLGAETYQAYERMEEFLSVYNIKNIETKKVKTPKFTIKAKKEGEADPVLKNKPFNKPYMLKKVKGLPKNKVILGFYVTFNADYQAYTHMDDSQIRIMINGDEGPAQYVSCYKGEQRVFVPYMKEGKDKVKDIKFEFAYPGDYYAEASDFKVEAVYADFDKTILMQF